MIKTIKKRVKRSIIWKIPTDEIRNKVSNATSLGQILREYGLQNKGRNSHTLKQRLTEDGIDFSHIKMGLGSNEGRKFWDINKLTKDEANRVLFIEKSEYDRKTVKRYLLDWKLFPYVCKECGQLPIWNNKPMVLILDHRNGISNDNRLSNLRWLCPNCNSQTETFCGRRKKY